MDRLCAKSKLNFAVKTNNGPRLKAAYPMLKSLVAYKAKNTMNAKIDKTASDRYIFCSVFTFHGTFVGRYYKIKTGISPQQCSDTLTMQLAGVEEIPRNIFFEFCITNFLCR